MKTRQSACVGVLVLLALVPLVQAQAPPGLGAAGAAGAGAAAGAAPPGIGAAGPAATSAPGATGAPTSNLWSFLCPTQQQCQECKDKFCNSQFGKLISGMLTPVSAFTGGVLGNCCPPNQVNPADLAKDPTSAEGAAARIKQSEADAKARRAAIRYLSTADCHRWPEAEGALINGLRADTNECVRWEAAMAISTGCCCTKPIIEALILTITGGNSDKNPVETSCRVKSAAVRALDHCLSHCDTCLEAEEAGGAPKPPVPPEKPVPPERPESPEALGGAGSAMGAFYEHVREVPLADVVREARATLARYSPQEARPMTLPPPGDQSLAQLMADAVAARSRPEQSAPPPALVAVAPPPAPQSQPQEQPAQAATLPPSGNRDLVHIFLHSVDQEKAAAPAPPPPVNPVSYTAPQPPPAPQTAGYSFLPARMDNTPTTPLPACTPRE